MFSNDNNIETIAQLVEELKRYVMLKGEYLRLNIVEKVVRLLTTIVMTFVLCTLFMLIIIFLSFCAAYAIATVTGLVGAFAIVSGAYFLLFILCIANRKKWIEKPLVHFLASILME